jgi:hypothetical protein
MTHCKPDVDMSGVDTALGDLVAAQLEFGKELLKVLAAGSGVLIDGAKGLKLPKGTGCCDIPEPCWMPKSLGDICCTLVPGDTGEVCLTIVNEDFRPHDYEVEAAGPDAGAVAIQGPDRKFQLGPKERRVVSVRAKVPEPDGRDGRVESCCDCDNLDLLIWVKGCSNHYLRWVIHRDAKKSKDCCHKVTVVDAPNYELHWYDHFHVMRPCMGPLQTA